MSGSPEFLTTEDKVQNIERYLVARVDGIHRLVTIAVVASLLAVILALWGVVGQERTRSLVRSASGSTDRSMIADAAPAVPERSAREPAVAPGELEHAGAPGPKPATKSAAPKAVAPKSPAPKPPAPKPPASPAGAAAEGEFDPPAAPSTTPPVPDRGRFRVDASAIAAEIAGLSPSGVAARFGREQPQVFCWSRISTPELEAIPAPDRVVTHRWRHDGQLVLERGITVGSTSYRVYSMLSNPGRWPGSWQVDIVDASGRVIGTEHFVIE